LIEERDCYNCYGRKSECANNNCPEQVKACNADKECRAATYKYMCYDYATTAGLDFYSDLVNEDTSNDVLQAFAKCVREYCFDEVDSDDVDDYEKQTTLEPGTGCDWGYAAFESVWEICLMTDSVTHICASNYAKRFQYVVEYGEGASVTWEFLDDQCVAIVEADKARRLQDVEQPWEGVETTKLENPWEKMTEEPDSTEPVPTELKCLQIGIYVVYTTEEAYARDKALYSAVAENADKLYVNADVTLISHSLTCCKETEICQSYSAKGSAEITSILAILAAIATLLFV
jgi:hypothetical protein